MGDRYILSLNCPGCNHKDDDVYFAPTCGFEFWHCPKCGKTIDLYKHTGLTYEDCSNVDLIKEEIDKISGTNRARVKPLG